MPDTRSIATHVLVGGLSAALAVCLMRWQRKEAKEAGSDTMPEEKQAGWLHTLYQDKTLEDADNAYREWHDDEWRKTSGWKGNDFIHARHSRGPRVLRYFHNRSESLLVGAVVFGPDSESHAGYCHGGSMTAVLDDVLGHTAFVTGGETWGGATVTVNCKLTKPIAIGSVLKVWGRVKERKGRTIFIDGGLEAEDGTVHALLDGVAVERTREELGMSS